MGKKVYIDSSNQFENIGNDGISEAQRMRDFSDKVIWYLRHGKADIEIFTNTQDMSLQETINHANSIDFLDCYIANHSNASSSNARGYEIYYSNYPVFSSESKFLADCLWNRVTLISDIDRGVYPDTRLYSSGLAVCRDVRHISVLHELFFHTNNEDINEYNSKKEQYAKSVALGIYDFLGLQYIETQPSDIFYRVITGSFKTKENAIKRVNDLKEKGFDSFIEIKK